MNLNYLREHINTIVEQSIFHMYNQTNVNLDWMNIVTTKIEVQGAKRGTINKQNQKAMLMFLHRI